MKTIAQTLQDPCASFWLKDALQSALKRDPVDASRDAELLNNLMGEHCRSVLGMESAKSALLKAGATIS